MEKENKALSVASPYGGDNRPAVPTSGVTSEVAQQREIAEVQGAIILAKKFPRNEKEAADKILIACQRPSLAEGAIYSYAKGGTAISGPSIRLAEAIAQNWGNLQFGIRELEQSNGESTVESFAWDMETNVRQIKIFQVPHSRYTKAKGITPLKDPRDIYEMVANQGARRLRSCILGIVPGDVIDAAVAQCEATLKTSADLSPEAMSQMVKAFEEIGVSKAQIEKRIQRGIDSMTAAQKVGLRNIHNSIKDGMSVAADWFEGVDTSKSDSVKPAPAKTAKDKKAEKETKKQSEPQKEPESSGKLQEVTGLVEHYNTKDGGTVEKPWTLHLVTINKLVYSTFDKKHGKDASDAHNIESPVTIVFEETAKGRNIKNIQIAD